jgi:hypothetical protein
VSGRERVKRGERERERARERAPVHARQEGKCCEEGRRQLLSPMPSISWPVTQAGTSLPGL